MQLIAREPETGELKQRSYSAQIRSDLEQQQGVLEEKKRLEGRVAELEAALAKQRLELEALKEPKKELEPESSVSKAARERKQGSVLGLIDLDEEGASVSEQVVPRRL